MATTHSRKDYQAAIAAAVDAPSFISQLLIDALEWPVPPDASLAEIAYDYTPDEVGAPKLDPKLAAGMIRQIVLPKCPWGIFILEFKRPDVFTSGRGLTTPLRQLLHGLVHHGRRNPRLPSFHREHLLFICTHDYKYYRFAHFRAPADDYKTPPLASFGWGPGDSIKTVAEYNLPHLLYAGQVASVDDWTAAWTKAFDVERVTKKFYVEYQSLHDRFKQAACHVRNANDRPWLASVVLNRLMFVYFLQKKGFVDNGNQSYLEEKLAACKKTGKDRFYADFLALLFFEGFAKPEIKRSAAAKAILGHIRYLNGGLFLEHRIEQEARAAGKPIDWPDDIFAAAFAFFASFSWNLNDIPGGEDNEINPDVLGYILEKYVNQKAFGAYYTRPEITDYLCQRTIHRLILDAVNTKGKPLPGVPLRNFDTVAALLKKLDENLATRLLEEILPGLALLDPACGSGAFLVAAMKTLIAIYAAVFSWIEFHGSQTLRARLDQIRAAHPSLDYFIKKSIITDNLFGVDLMPEAVEIARLRLFLALVASADKSEQLEPLPNIDFNIMAGNSLIGLLDVKPAKFDQGKLFGLTYEQIVADRDRKLETYRHTAAYAEDLTGLRDGITAINDQAQKQLNDLLLDQFNDLDIKFEQAIWDDKKGAAGKPIKRRLAAADIDRLRPFHWAFAFSKVMRRGGFDAIITNPPWEVFEASEKEFLEEMFPEMRPAEIKRSDWADEFTKRVKSPTVRKAWLDRESQFAHVSSWFKGAADYAHQQPRDENGKVVPSKLNLFRLFVERCYRLLRDDGSFGQVIPSTLWTGRGAQGLRKLLLTKTEITGSFGFRNTKLIFDGVGEQEEFLVLTCRKGGTTTTFPATFMREDLAELERFPADAQAISAEMLHRASPVWLKLPELSTATDIDLLKKLSSFARLGGKEKTDWALSLYQEINMSEVKVLVRNSNAKDRLPVVQGDNIHQFVCDTRSTFLTIDEPAGRNKILGRTADVGQSLRYQGFRLVHQRIARKNQQRSLSATIIPPQRFCADTVLTPREALASQVNLFLVGMLNSYVADFQMRMRITSHLDKHFMDELPVPRLTTGDAGFAEIVERSAKLICTTPEFDDLAKEAGLTARKATAPKPPPQPSPGVPGEGEKMVYGVTDPAERAKLRAELDGIVAHLYGLTEAQFEHVLATFPLVDPAVRADALAAYRKLIETGDAARYNPDLPKPQKTGAAIAPADQAVLELIAAGESKTVEFKSTARFNVKANQPDPKMERIIAKTVAAFLNTAGGTLLIGVTDDGTVRGLADDYATLKKADRDGFELWLMQTLLNDFEKDAAGQISISFHALGKQDGDARPGVCDVCRVDATASPRPRFVKEDGQERFYVRTGNASNALSMKEMFAYFAQRWPGAFTGAAGK